MSAITWGALNARVIVMGAVLALVSSAAHAQEGVKQVEQLIKHANATVKSIDATKAQLLKAMNAYNLVMAPETADRKSAYSKLQKAMNAAEKSRADISRHADAMNAEADALFQNWNASMAAISDAALRAKSEKRLGETRVRYADIQAQSLKAGGLYEAFMRTLHDHMIFLGHDLNGSAVASLKEESAKLNTLATELFAAIDQATGAATTNIGALTPRS
jgi:uncharacterized protein with GYD domain